MRAAIPARATVAYGLIPDAYAMPSDWTSVVRAFTEGLAKRERIR
jgi:hypothetical protein